tara:strand:- start:2361 stop:2633 length:273 start_codon:yes stop_codon:yes gene_type:complete
MAKKPAPIATNPPFGKTGLTSDRTDALMTVVFKNSGRILAIDPDHRKHPHRPARMPADRPPPDPAIFADQRPEHRPDRVLQSVKLWIGGV